MIFYFKYSDKSFDNVAVRGGKHIFRPLTILPEALRTDNPFCALRSKKKMKSSILYLSSRLRAKRGSGLPKKEQRKWEKIERGEKTRVTTAEE